MKMMGKLLSEIKGGAQGQAISKSEVAAAADSILAPVMDLLDGSLSMYAENCDKSVLKRLLKQLWRIVMRSLERNIVLPPINEKVGSYLIFFIEDKPSILKQFHPNVSNHKVASLLKRRENLQNKKEKNSV